MVLGDRNDLEIPLLKEVEMDKNKLKKHRLLTPIKVRKK